jgi:hypothetical protein
VAAACGAFAGWELGQPAAFVAARAINAHDPNDPDGHLTGGTPYFYALQKAPDAGRPAVVLAALANGRYAGPKAAILGGIVGVGAAVLVGAIVGLT